MGSTTEGPATSLRDPLAEGRPRRRLTLIKPSSGGPPLLSDVRDVDRAYRPVYAVWELTLRCDLSCRHCGSRAGPARPDELSLAEALDLVRQLAELGVREVTLIGGEAYLYPGWTEVIAAIRAAGMDSTMVTGGRAFNSERARAAASAGLQSLAVSIDGDARAHDLQRGVDGAHAAALSALRTAREAGLQIAVNTQINRVSMPHLPAISELLIDAGAHGWQVQLTVPMGRAADEPELMLQPHDLLELFPMLAELKRRLDSAGVKLVTGNNVGYFGPYDHLLRQAFPCGHSTVCPAGHHVLGIEANGDIKGCPSLPTESWVGGNIRQRSLLDIWERSEPLRFNRKRSTDQLWGFCASCYYADECHGGCTWMSTSLFGRPGNNPYCHHRALELARRGQRERVQLVSEAPGTPFDHARFEIVLESAHDAADQGHRLSEVSS
jgi:radical SAM protein with 4Fe4S-binding SPASM domain